RVLIVACRAWRACYQRAGRAPLELEANGELHGTRAADLIQRAEAATLSPASQRTVRHLRGLPELLGAEVVEEDNWDPVHCSLRRLVSVPDFCEPRESPERVEPATLSGPGLTLDNPSLQPDHRGVG